MATPTTVTRAGLESGNRPNPKSGTVYVLTEDGNVRGALRVPTDETVRQFDRIRKAFSTNGRKISRLQSRLIVAETKLAETAAKFAQGEATEAEFEAAEAAADSIYAELDALDAENPDAPGYFGTYLVNRAASVLHLTRGEGDDAEALDSLDGVPGLLTAVVEAVVEDFAAAAFLSKGRPKKN